MRRLYTISALLTVLALSSCDYLFLGNICADEGLMKGVKLQTAYYVWRTENPGIALLVSLLAGLSAISGGKEELPIGLVKKLTLIAESLKLEDVAEAQRLSEGHYRCSAVFSYKEKRLAVVYSITRIHAGKEDLYEVKVQDVDWIK